MGTQDKKPSGPDLAQGVVVGDVADGGMLAGHVGDDAVLVARRGKQFYAIGATCTHYSGPLAEGLMVDETVHCPWHHARFCLRTGRVLSPPASVPLRTYPVRVEANDILVDLE